MSVHLQAEGNEALKVLLKHPSLKNVSIGISVKSVKTGKEIVSYRSEKSMQPASLVKIFTTGLALNKCGRSFRYKTLVSHTGTIENGSLKGDIIIEASGDPTPDSRFFQSYKLLETIDSALLKAGITAIEGSIIVLPSEEQVNMPASWVWEDISNYYAAPHRPFNYRDNTYWLDFETGEAGTPAKLKSITPPTLGVVFMNNVTASKKNTDDAWIFGGPYTNTFYIKGTIPQRRESFKIRGAMYAPAANFIKELSTKLAARKVSINNKNISDTRRTTLVEYKSPSLEEIVYATNKNSINLFSEALGALVDDSDFSGVCKRTFMRIGIDTAGVALQDACGLSPFSAVPASVFTDYLIWAYRNIGKAFLNSLPVAGKDIPLSPYSKNNGALINKLRAKTGSFSGVRCLAGYIKTSQNEEYSFCIMLNHCRGKIATIQDAVGLFLATLI
ncbi:D-alanyl-D-alanine carboxypeptidase DacC [Bacteroidia bacterium]|nr:D-alanyl-D-alanine carboxypeptidase DacC [Bacteroidia bacterium]